MGMLQPHQILAEFNSVIPEAEREKLKDGSFEDVLRAAQAEKIAYRMIYEDRMRGSIDEVEAVIHLADDSEELQQWDQQPGAELKLIAECQTADAVVLNCWCLRSSTMPRRQYFYYCFSTILGTSITGFMQEHILIDDEIMSSGFSSDSGTDR